MPLFIKDGRFPIALKLHKFKVQLSIIPSSPAYGSLTYNNQFPLEVKFWKLLNDSNGFTFPVNAGTAAVQTGATPESINFALILSLSPQASWAKII